MPYHIELFRGKLNPKNLSKMSYRFGFSRAVFWQVTRAFCFPTQGSFFPELVEKELIKTFIIEVYYSL